MNFSESSEKFWKVKIRTNNNHLEEVVRSNSDKVVTISPHVKPVINDDHHPVPLGEESLELVDLAVAIETLVA